MPRYIVERAFPDGFRIPISEAGERLCRSVIHNNTRNSVTWIHSYVSEDLTKTFCVYDAPSPEAIRSAAAANNHSVVSITPVRVLDPYFYRT